MLPPRPEDSNLDNGSPVIATSGNGTGGDLVPVRQELPYLQAPSWPVGPTRPEILTAGPDPIALLHGLKRRWILASVAGLISAAVMAIAALWLWPETYAVEALLRVNRNSGPVLPGTRGRYDPRAYESYLRTQVGLLKSDMVMIAALRDPAISQLPLLQAQSDKVSWLQDVLVVDNPRESELLRVSIRDVDQHQLVKIIDAVIDSYFDEYVYSETQQKRKNLQRLEDTLQQKEEDLRQKNSSFLGLLAQVGTGTEEIYSLNSLKTQELRDLRYNQRELHKEDRNVTALIQQLKLQQKSAEEDQMPQYLLQTELKKDEEYQSLLAQAQEMRARINSIESAYNDPQSNPSWQSAKGGLLKIEERLDEIRLELEPLIAAAANDDLQIEDQLEVQQGLKKSIEEALDVVGPQIKEVQEVLARIGKSSPDIKALETDIETLNVTIRQYNQQVEGLRLEVDSPSSVQWVQRATPPEASDWVQRYLLVGFSSIAGFFLAVFGVAIWDFQSRRVNSSEQIAEGLGLRLVGTLPVLAERQALLPVGRNKRGTLESVLTESIDSIRATLIHNAKGAAHQVVLVTSAMDQEGKTTVASQLAVSLARSGRRTLLVDTDLRNPTGHRLFELSLEDGLSEVLRGQADLDDVIRPTRAAGLWMVSAGRCDIESLQELARGSLQPIFERLKAQFDFVIVDSAPVLTVADTLIVGQVSDAVVLSVLRSVSRLPKVYEATERLESVGVVVLGVVVNGTRSTSHRRMYELSLPASA